jgi:hypothetical protein
MSRSISARLGEKEIELLNEIAKNERIDRSALVRKFVLQQIEEYQMKHMAEYYRKGVMSLAEAATAAHVSIYAMMIFCKREDIQPLDETDEEMEREFIRGREIYANHQKKKESNTEFSKTLHEDLDVLEKVKTIPAINESKHNSK